MIEAILVVFFVGLDQLAKHLTDLYLMPLGSTVPLWDGVLHLTSAHNTGAAFSLFSGGRWVFIAITILACIVITLLLVKKRRKLHLLFRVALSLVLAGALGNLIDRAALGYVRDMIDFRLIHFAIFNVADSCVTVGAAIVFLDILFGKGRLLFAGDRAGKQASMEASISDAAQEQPEEEIEEIETAEAAEAITGEETGGESAGDTRGRD